MGNKSISITGTNVVVLYGNGAAEKYAEMINRWSDMLFSTQWNSFQFILAGTEMPDVSLNENAASLVDDQNTVFYSVQETPPDSYAYHNLIFDKIQSDNVHLHLIIDDGGSELSFDWLRSLIRAAKQIESLSTSCLYYLMINRNSAPEEREKIISMLEEMPGSVFFVGDTNADGGRVLPEDRWHAVEIAILMNSAEAFPVRNSAYSFGYSSLNANGSELRILRESAACRALQTELNRPIQTMSEADLFYSLLPEGVKNLSNLREWLTEKVKNLTQLPKASAMKNAWVMIRMGPELSATEAVQRMKRFADLNYAGNGEVRKEARNLADEVENRLRAALCEQTITACLSPKLPEEIATAFHRLRGEGMEPGSCVYPSRPKLRFWGKGMDEYLDKCRSAVAKTISDYIAEKNISTFAGEMEKAYLRLADWIRSIQEEPMTGFRKTTALDLLHGIQKELEGSDAGNAMRLGQKYQGYLKELTGLYPSLQMLTEGIRETYYLPSGSIEKQGWKNLVAKAAANLEKKLPAGFRGDFFKVLSSEFDTTLEREKFFDEYLRNGIRMYRNLSAQIINGTSVLLADNRLTDQWFVQRDIYGVRTDNAENLTFYPLGDLRPEEFLRDTTVYFKGTGSGSGNGGKSIFSGRGALQTERPEAPTRSGNSLFNRGDQRGPEGPFGDAGRQIDQDQKMMPDEKEDQNVRMVPDEKNEYRLYWPWNGNDQTAMVEIFQFGERVGKVAVIPVKQFHENGENLNVTTSVMEGKPLPRGMLSVSIRDSKNSLFIREAQVLGRRDVVRYKISNTKLQVKPENRQIAGHLLLRTIDPDGQYTFYPLYPAAQDSPWLFEGLAINNGRIVADPAAEGMDIYPIRSE